MKRALKWLAFALLGILIGAGAAWIQRVPAPAGSSPEAAIQITPPTNLGQTGEAPAPAELTAAEQEVIASEPAITEEATSLVAQDKMLSNLPPLKKLSAEEKAALEQKKAEAAKPQPEPEPMKPLVSGVNAVFSLVDHDGQPVTEKSWPGRYLFVFFGFTHCPDICPVTLDKVTSALNKLGDAAAKVQPLFISVDPLRDTPEVMKEYVGHFHKSIIGLTGTEAQVKAAEDSFKVYAARTPGQNPQEYSFDHSAYVYLINPEGGMAEIIRMQDKAGEIADKLKPYLAAAQE
jgi:protein SCO1